MEQGNEWSKAQKEYSNVQNVASCSKNISTDHRMNFSDRTLEKTGFQDLAAETYTHRSIFSTSTLCKNWPNKTKVEESAFTSQRLDNIKCLNLQLGLNPDVVPQRLQMHKTWSGFLNMHICFRPIVWPKDWSEHKKPSLRRKAFYLLCICS